MTRITFIALCLSITSEATSDEIVLKDGKKIEWRTISDGGDSYQVETSAGIKLTVKKSDIEKMLMNKSPEQGALTGASFTFDKKKSATVDLLSKVNLKSENTSGTWKWQGGSLMMTSGRAPIEFTPVPEEYDLSVTIERREGEGELFVGFVAGGTQGVVRFDVADNGPLSGLEMIDGKTCWEWDGDGTTKKGKLFKTGTQRILKLTVRKEALVVQIDGKDLFVWKADWKRISTHRVFSIGSNEHIWIGSSNSGWKISSLSLTFQK